MAIVQISRITNRKGLQDDLPQLDGGELGWAVDSRRLYIGNGTLAEGAPVIGNTEILTEFSDITVLSDYTYQDIAVGYAAQTGASAGSPVVRSVQAKLDDQASVRDFGAVGDGITDDTAAINRALYELFCREVNPQVRRSLFFPAGTYLVTDTVRIPPFAKLMGEGAGSTTILMSSTSLPSETYMVRFSDSSDQTDDDLGLNGAITPQRVEISSLTFQTAQARNIFEIAGAQQCWFDSVEFLGPETTTTIKDPGFDPDSSDDFAAVRFFNNGSVITCQDITFDRCRFSGLAKAIDTSLTVGGVTVTNSVFDTLYYGITLGRDSVTGTGPRGFRTVHNRFNNIYAQGIIYDDATLNVSAYNLFLDVADRIGQDPSYAVITFGNDNNISVGDFFARTDSDIEQYGHARIQINSTSIDNLAAPGSELRLGRYARDLGRGLTLSQGTTVTVAEININVSPAFDMDYVIVRDGHRRVGALHVATGVSDSVSWSDDFTETADTGVSLSASVGGNTITVSCVVSSGTDAVIKYSLQQLA